VTQPPYIVAAAAIVVRPLLGFKGLRVLSKRREQRKICENAEGACAPELSGCVLAEKTLFVM
jgi:hypothetical protein